MTLVTINPKRDGDNVSGRWNPDSSRRLGSEQLCTKSCTKAQAAWSNYRGTLPGAILGRGPARATENLAAKMTKYLNGQYDAGRYEQHDCDLRAGGFDCLD